MMGKTRAATHAGSWYAKEASKLDSLLTGWLNSVTSKQTPARVIISPHAGYSYCGETAAHAYRQINPETTKRVFILGPSHRAYLDGCALPEFTKYDTPLGAISHDIEALDVLRGTGEFSVMNETTDSAEHSIEMQLPYLQKVMQGRDYKIVPILVGQLHPNKAKMYGELLTSHFLDPGTICIVSTDFCHWGDRFDFQPVDKSFKTIYEGITAMDRAGMYLIEKKDAEGFEKYLHDTENTICGRYPLQIMLHAINRMEANVQSVQVNMRFLHYSQSNNVTDIKGSSVSYAAGAATYS
eukprot:CFRG1546T1